VCEHLDGVVTVTGGRDRTTWWQPTATPRARWQTLVTQLQSVGDSARAAAPGARRDARFRMADPDVAVTARGPVLIQAVHAVRADGGNVVVRVGVTDGHRLGTGATLAQALVGIGASPAIGPSGSVSSMPPRLDDDGVRLYDQMRRAMQRGDWTAFGAAFDSLGLALKRPPP
jgi:hypothetical protein